MSERLQISPELPVGRRRTRAYTWLVIGRSFARNRTAMFGVGFTLFAAIVAIFAPWIAPDPIFLDFDAVLESPSASHIFGTDGAGRDEFARVIYGARVSLQVGVLAVTIAGTAGVLSGIAAGYYGGWVDSVIMRVVDAILAFPALLLAVFLVGIMGPSLRNAMLAISVTFIPRSRV